MAKTNYSLFNTHTNQTIVFNRKNQMNMAVISKLVREINLEDYYMIMTVGESATLSATVFPATAENKQLIWESGSNSIAPVNPQTGLIRALQPGKTVITVSATDGSGKIAKCTVSVRNKNSYRTTPFQIYLSPEVLQKEYLGYDKTVWNEKKNMELVGNYVKQYLSDYSVDVYLDTKDWSNSDPNFAADGRPEEANRWITDKSKCQYVALHSNAGADGSTTVRGTMVFYNARGKANTLAENLEQAIVRMLPTGSNRSTPVQQADGNPGSTYKTLGELRDPYNDNIPSVLIESAFHDNPNEVQFLVTKQKPLAKTIAKVLADFYDLAPKK